MKKIFIAIIILVSLGAIPVYSQYNDVSPKMDEIAELFLDSEYDKALSLCDESIQQYPDNAELYHWKSMIYKEQKDYKKALTNIQKAINLKPKHSEYYFAKAMIYSDMDNSTGAIQTCTQAIKRFPGEYKFYTIRAGEKRKIGNLTGAEKDYKKALEIVNYFMKFDPDSSELKTQRSAIKNVLKSIEQSNNSGQE